MVASPCVYSFVRILQPQVPEPQLIIGVTGNAVVAINISHGCCQWSAAGPQHQNHGTGKGFSSRVGDAACHGLRLGPSGKDRQDQQHGSSGTDQNGSKMDQRGARSRLLTVESFHHSEAFYHR